MKTLSIQVGGPKSVPYGDEMIFTSIFKSPVSGPVMVRTLNIDGDKQSDLTVHGGRDKAVYAYSFDAYPWWRARRPQDKFEYGAMGENFTLDAISEDEACIGDRYEVGKAVLEVVQPRFPCFKLGIMYDDPHIIREFVESKRPGVYFRVLQEGETVAGDEWKLVEREPIRCSISELFRIGFTKDTKPERAREILKIKSLTEGFRRKLEKISSDE